METQKELLKTKKQKHRPKMGARKTKELLNVRLLREITLLKL